jgi:hypothetical protein
MPDNRIVGFIDPTPFMRNPEGALLGNTKNQNDSHSLG